jgi:hypothetical protein
MDISRSLLTLTCSDVFGPVLSVAHLRVLLAEGSDVPVRMIDSSRHDLRSPDDDCDAQAEHIEFLCWCAGLIRFTLHDVFPHFVSTFASWRTLHVNAQWLLAEYILEGIDTL